MNVYVVIPAAGIGKRVGGSCAKQYLPLHGRPMIMHTLDAFLKHPRIETIVVAIHPQDDQWKQFKPDSGIISVEGGRERCHSVLNGLRYLSTTGIEDDAWVMVHDAARPCVSQDELGRLIDAVKDHPVGGLLGTPMVDTVKKVMQGSVISTVDRSQLWRALTPQMFRFSVLYRALQRVIDADTLVSDESMAVEMAGHSPLMVEGSSRNIKVTYPQDLDLAARYLQEMT